MVWLRLLFFALAIYLAWRLLFPRSGRRREAGKWGRGGKPLPEEMKQDPVCGTWVPITQAEKAEINGETYYFCSRACRDRYLESIKKS
ncbi:MAG TPA: YHS domain-containing protein [Candidatus Aminicenantes bacterium]|nr:YHS domain-containing protein [Candidatus Aminicenantes bacterium]